MSEYNQIQAKLINILNRKVVKHKTIYKSDNNVILIDGKDKYYYTIHRIGNTNMGILMPVNMDNAKANCWYIVGKNLFDGGENPDTHEYVDLGLPSGTLWATDNIKDEDGNELYFAWGETTGYRKNQVGSGKDKQFTWDDYEFGTSNNLTKYNSTDDKTTLDASDDAATVYWGLNWKMPTKEQFQELATNSNIQYTQVNGIKGLLLTSKNNANTLFLQAVSLQKDGNSYYPDGYGDYWSNSLSSDGYQYASSFEFNIDGVSPKSKNRNFGCSVRPVRVSN